MRLPPITSRGVWQPLETEKDTEMNSRLKPPERISANALILAS